MSEWSHDEILHFLECYQTESVIWDPQNKNHKDKKKVADAWGRLSVKLNTPVHNIKLKKEILMGTFRRHLKKKQDSIRSGAGADDVYEPIWFAYPIMESFLLPVYTTRQTINTEQEQSTSQIAEENFGDETNDSERMEPISSPPAAFQTEEETRSTTSARRTHRRPRSDPAEQQMATAFSQLTNALSHRQSQNTPPVDDECDLYAKLLATKLRDFPKDERKLIMYEIDTIFIRKIQNRRERDTPSPSYYSPPSSASTPYSRPPSASTPYSRPPSASSTHSRPPSASSTYSKPPSASTPYSRPPSASSTYSRPPSASSTRPSSVLNFHTPNQPSTSLILNSEPITNTCTSNQIHASSSEPNLKKPIYLQRPLSVQSSNTYKQPPSAESNQRIFVKSPFTKSVKPVSIQIQTPPTLKLPSALSASSKSIQPLSVEIPHPSYTNSFQPPEQLSHLGPEESETTTNTRSSIIDMALLNTFEQFDAEERE